MWKLLSGQAFESTAPGHHPVYLTPSFEAQSLWRSNTVAGFLELSEETLVLTTADCRREVSRRHVLQVRPLSLYRNLCRMDPWGRILARPVELRWTTEDGIPEIVLIASRAGASFRRDRLFDRELYRVLSAWSSAAPGAPQPLLPTADPAFRGSAFAIAALSTGLLIVAAHMNAFPRIQSGEWLPPDWIQPRSLPLPLGLPRQALAGDFALAVTNLQTLWRVDLTTGRSRALRPALVFHSVSLNASAQTAIEFQNLMLNPEYVTPLRPLHSRGDYISSPRIVSARTGRAPELNWYPEGIQGPPLTTDFAMHGAHRIFQAIPGGARLPNNDSSSSSWVLKCFDIASGENRIVATTSTQKNTHERNDAIFFPDGTHVLWQGCIANVETGEVRLVQPINSVPSSFSLVSLVFSAGHRIRLVRPDLAATASKPDQETEVWEIDPEDALATRTATLPRGMYLVNADEDRWLLMETDRATGTEKLLLHNHRNGITTALPHAPAKAEFHRLVAGQNYMYSGVKGKGWVKTSLPSQ